MLYKTFWRGGERVALPVEDAVKTAMPGIRAMLYPESHDPIGQVAEICILTIYHFGDSVIQLPILPHSSPQMGKRYPPR
jgi:hypothetical protein